MQIQFKLSGKQEEVEFQDFSEVSGHIHSQVEFVRACPLKFKLGLYQLFRGVADPYTHSL